MAGGQPLRREAYGSRGYLEGLKAFAERPTGRHQAQTLQDRPERAVFRIDIRVHRS